VPLTSPRRQIRDPALAKLNKFWAAALCSPSLQLRQGEPKPVRELLFGIKGVSRQGVHVALMRVVEGYLLFSNPHIVAMEFIRLSL
jgi:hypothetical protein